jgi:hypothetical protein
MRYLKQGLDRYGSPKLATIGYNAGHDHPFLLGEADKPPEESLNYVNRINDLGGFIPTPAKEEEAPKPPSDITPASEDDMRSLQAAGLGGGVGLGLGTAYSVGSRMLGSPSASPQGGGQASALKGGQFVPTPEQAARMGQGTTVDDLTGRARQTAYNEQTAAQAARRKAAESTLAQLQRKGLVTGDVLSKAQGMTSTPSGVLLPQSVVYEREAQQQAAKALAEKQASSPLNKDYIEKTIDDVVNKRAVNVMGIGDDIEYIKSYNKTILGEKCTINLGKHTIGGEADTQVFLTKDGIITDGFAILPLNSVTENGISDTAFYPTLWKLANKNKTPIPGMSMDQSTEYDVAVNKMKTEQKYGGSKTTSQRPIKRKSTRRIRPYKTKI